MGRIGRWVSSERADVRAIGGINEHFKLYILLFLLLC